MKRIFLFFLDQALYWFSSDVFSITGVNDYRDLSEQDYDMMLDDTPRGDYSVFQWFLMTLCCVWSNIWKYCKQHQLSINVFAAIFSSLSPDEVERLLRDYQQNQDFIRNLGNRFYQIIYPIQVRQRERFGVSTREIENSYGKVMLLHKYCSLVFRVNKKSL